jgi:hypothetical protein
VASSFETLAGASSSSQPEGMLFKIMPGKASGG